MADEDQLKHLLQGVQAWNVWRDQNPYVRKDLSDADLSGLDLSGARLFHANLSRAKLINTGLVRADLQDCNLTGADLSNADLTGANLAQSDLRGAILNRAVLMDANLLRGNASNAQFRGANLERANLESRRLTGADLEQANLRSTILKTADLSGALLRNADLSGAQLQEATLSDTCIAGANLENADLSDAKGIVQAQLAGTNLYHAKLSDQFADFEELKRVAEIAKYSRRVFSFLLLLCVFSWLVIFQATDKALVANSMVATLPHVQVPVPIASVFYFMPVVLFALFTYFQMNLQGLWEGLASLPAVFPNGEILPHRAFPWIVTSVVYLFVSHLSNRRSTYWRWNVLIMMLEVWILAPVTILWFWLRYMRVGDWIGAFWLLFWVCLIILFAIHSFMDVRKTFAKAGMMPLMSTQETTGGHG